MIKIKLIETVITNFKKNKLVKVLSFNSISVIISFISGFISIKFIAHFLGAEGLAILGNFKNFTTSVKAFSTFGFNSGIVKLIAEHKENSEKINEISTTSFISRFILSILISFSLLIFSRFINEFIFVGNTFYNVIIIFAIFLPIYTINTFLISIINGFQKFKSLITIHIISNISGLLITLLLISKEMLFGALIATATVESFIIIISIYYFKKTTIQLKIKFKCFSKKTLNKLLTFSAMALVTAIVVPGSSFLLRSFIIDSEGLNKAGQWEALTRISSYYMMIVSSGLTMYYLPKLASLKTSLEFRKELKNYYKVIVPIFIIAASIVYIFKKQVILIVLNKEFLPISELFIWQIIGDIFKIFYLAFSYQILAKAMMKKYIVIEILYFILYILLGHYFINLFQVKGVVIAYTIINFLSFLAMIVIFRKIIFNNFKTN
jgi:PST family polysaccharide transporter